MSRAHLSRVLAAGCLALLAACTPSASPAPRTEFLLSAGDSTYWVTRGADGRLRARGSPLVLARFDGHLYELFVTDDDRSYEDAVFIGQRLYRRDLTTGDSVLLYEDAEVPKLAAAYALANPGARTLGEDEDVPENPRASATAELSVLDVHGPFLSFEYHADVEGRGRPGWHTTRRGVVDLRDGTVKSVEALFGTAVGARVARRGRRDYLATLDAVLDATDERARRAIGSLASFRFDETSFSLTELDGAPAVAFAAPGKGSGGAGWTIPLAPIAAADAPWWRGQRDELPKVDGDSSAVTWGRDGLVVVIRYDSSSTSAPAVLQGPGGEWPIGRVQLPVHRLFWLDRPPLAAAVRRGLARAFDEAVLYDDDTRVAQHGAPAPDPAHPNGTPAARVTLASFRR